MLDEIITELQKYKRIGTQALTQVSDDALNFVPGEHQNSIAMIVRHLHGNLQSRFTDFLTTDGEKDWRNRAAEFAVTTYSRAEVENYWQQGWGILLHTLSTLSEKDLRTVITIKATAMTAEAALYRTLAHIAYHTGQIVLLAHMQTAADWQWISTPPHAQTKSGK